MAYFEIYVATGNKRRWHLQSEIQGAMRGALAFWLYLEDKYLPAIHSPIDSEVKLSRLFADGGKRKNEIWRLWMDSRLTNEERLVLFTTFDEKYLPIAYVPEVVSALRSVHKEMGEGSILSTIADKMESIYNNKGSIKYIAFNATSVSYYEDIMGRCMDKDKLSDLWEDYFNATRMIEENS